MASSRKGRSSPSFKGLAAASAQTSRIARASSRKRDTKCELLLRRALWRLGLRYRVSAAGLPGRPDIVFRRARVVVFVDGDFWHGRDLQRRLAKLEAGHNAKYWVEKIRANVARDARTTNTLTAEGWAVFRFWESDVRASVDAVAETIRRAVLSRLANL